jgi:hypothetical protein
MVRSLQFLIFIVAPLLALAASARGGQSTEPPVTIEYYYRLAPGGSSEWLALYKKNHNPLLKELMKEGLLKSEFAVLQYGMQAGSMKAWPKNR